MDLPPLIDDCIKESIDYSLGLPLAAQTLESRLRASEEVQKGLRDQCSLLHSRLKEKDGLIELARAEASMNAQALKKFAEENQKLAAECRSLLTQCDRWERECSLYENDRDALMDFGNEAHEKAKEAEARVQELEEEVEQLSHELQRYEHKLDSLEDDGTEKTVVLEESLLESVLEMLVSRDGFASAHAFLEANSSHEQCRKLFKMWNCLSPFMQKVVSLAAEVKALQKDKELLRINLHRAEEEVKVLFDENSILEAENKRLVRHYRKAFGSGERSGDSAKSQKRKSSPKVCSPIEKTIDFNNLEPARSPLSPIKCNSPVYNVQK